MSLSESSSIITATCSTEYLKLCTHLPSVPYMEHKEIQCLFIVFQEDVNKIYIDSLRKFLRRSSITYIEFCSLQPLLVPNHDILSGYYYSNAQINIVSWLKVTERLIHALEPVEMILKNPKFSCYIFSWVENFFFFKIVPLTACEALRVTPLSQKNFIIFLQMIRLTASSSLCHHARRSA